MVTSGGFSSVKAFESIRLDTMRKLKDPDGFSANPSGSALITASHWGHVDQRKTQFQALLDLIEHDGHWQLADLTLIDIKQTN